MNAMILAAGFGSRLASLGEPKPLVPVAGVALLELSIRQAAKSGVTRFVVVTGHRSAEIELHLEGFASRTGLAIEVCRLDDWSRPNGHSVLAGARCMAGNYLLMMADHIFSSSILDEMVARMSLDAGAALAIDRDIAGPMVDPDDATFVAMSDDGRIAEIGKGLGKRDAVDCGVFIATPDLAAAIAQAIEHGAAGSLSEGMHLLANRGLASTVDVTGRWWIDVDDPNMHALAERYAPQHLPEIFASDRLANVA
jgi:1L-myo-inositol 1-phosphate cytidylyltransferase